MITYILRRLMYMIPILIGINIIIFALFFIVNTPDDIARMHLGHKHVSQTDVETWKRHHGYNKPLFYDTESEGVQRFTETIFFEKSLKLFAFDFGRSDSGRDISADIMQRMWPSLAIAIPSLILGLLINISLALLIVFFRGSYLDTLGIIICVMMMSVSLLFYIVGGQYFLSKVLKWVPISGYLPDWNLAKFLFLPVIIGVIGGIGSGTRWYRTLFIEEVNKEYVKMARSKGLSELSVLFKHVLPNALIPILTGVVVLLPLLFMGSLLTESFFGIPGLGSYTIDAIQQQDFAIVRSMVFLGAFLYVIGLILTDISYTMVDPRVRFN